MRALFMCERGIMGYTSQFIYIYIYIGVQFSID